MNPIEEFSRSYPSLRTQSSYRSNLNTYFRIIKADPDKYFKEKRNYSEDVIKFWESQKDIAPLSKASRLSCVRIFLEDNDVIIPKKIWKQIKRKDKSPHAITIDQIPTNIELKKILSHAEIKGKALFLLLSSSGMRINEALQLTEEDIDFKHNPAKIYVRAEITKTKQSRICFMSNEAKEYIFEWLKIRHEWLIAAIKKTEGLKKRKQVFTKKLDDSTIFCFHYSTAKNIWNRVLEKSGYDKKDRSTNFHRMHIHVLRKFFKTRMLNAGVEEPILNQIVGHTGYLDSSYYRFTEQDIINGYNKGLSSVLVFEIAPDLTETHKEMEEIKQENKSLKQEMDRIRIELLEVKFKQVQELQKKKLSKC